MLRVIAYQTSDYAILKFVRATCRYSQSFELILDFSPQFQGSSSLYRKDLSSTAK